MSDASCSAEELRQARAERDRLRELLREAVYWLDVYEASPEEQALVDRIYAQIDHNAKANGR